MLIWLTEISVKPYAGLRVAACGLGLQALLLAYPTPAKAQFSGGNGSESNPYKITTAEQLSAIRSCANQYLSFILINDLDLQGYDAGDSGGWLPIGHENQAPFNGTFNGNGKTIRNLTICRPSMEQVGLFGYIAQGAALLNLTLENAYIVAGKDVGSLVGIMVQSSVVSGCHSSGLVKGKVSVGGLVGYARTGSLVKNSSTDCTIYGFGDYTGGLLGEMYAATIENSFSKGHIYSATSNTGGLVAYLSHGSTMLNCYSVAHVTDIDDTVNYHMNQNSGGLLGQAFYKSRIENCYASGNVLGGFSVGGLAGYVAQDVHMQNNVALNRLVEGNDQVHELLGGEDMTISPGHQYKRRDMQVKKKDAPPSSYISDLNHDIEFEEAQVPFYKSIGWQFGVDENHPWCFNDSTGYPELWFEGLPLSSLSLSTNLVTLYPGDTCALLEPVFEPANARLKLVSWSSGNPEVASVDSNGMLIANDLGFTTVQLESVDGNHKAVCRVNVIPRPSDTGGVEEEQVTLHLYPNPVRDVLNVIASEQIFEVKVYSTMGQLLIERRNLLQSFTAVDVSHLPKGMYLVVVRTLNGNRTLKFVTL